MNRGSNTIDLNTLNAELQMAQQSGRKMCTIHVDELMSLLARAEALSKVQEFVPFKVGYCYPEDVHLLMQGELHRVGLSRKKGPKYTTEVLVYHLPSGKKQPLDVVAET